MVADAQSPGKFDLHTGFDPYSLTNFGAKAAQEPNFQAGGQQASFHPWIPQTVPEDLFDERCTRAIGAQAVLIELNGTRIHG